MAEIGEKQIGEIIGWERHEKDAAWHPNGEVAYRAIWYTPPGVTVIDAYGCQPNVDDMLAWLLSKVDDMDVNYKRTTREWFVWVEIASGDGYHEPRDPVLDDEYCGSSLFAACEEAVRAVDPFVQ